MMIGGLLLALSLAPLIALIGCLVARRPRVCEALNVIASALSFGCALPLPFLVDGAPNKVIAQRLQITEATVKVHVKAILRKIRVKNRTQAAIWAAKHLPFPEALVCDRESLHHAS